MSTPEQNLEIARRYLAAVGRGDGSESLSFYADEAVQVEFPNRLTPNGVTRDLQALREAAARGSKVMLSQRFELLNAVASGDQVAMEARWTGTIAVPIGSIAAGGEMRARFAIFLTFRDGRIVRQHNYDCFDPW